MNIASLDLVTFSLWFPDLDLIERAGLATVGNMETDEAAMREHWARHCQNLREHCVVANESHVTIAPPRMGV